MTILDDCDTDEYVPEEIIVKVGDVEPSEVIHSMKIET